MGGSALQVHVRVVHGRRGVNGQNADGPGLDHTLDRLLPLLAGEKGDVLAPDAVAFRDEPAGEPGGEGNVSWSVAEEEHVAVALGAGAWRVHEEGRGKDMRVAGEEVPVSVRQEGSQSLAAVGLQRPAVLFLDERDGVVAVGGRVVLGGEVDQFVAGVLVVVDLLGVLLQLVPPVLADAIAEDAHLAGDTTDVNGVAALVLEAAERLDGRVILERHQVVAKPLEL